jgi:hypothetical protein
MKRQFRFRLLRVTTTPKVQRFVGSKILLLASHGHPMIEILTPHLEGALHRRIAHGKLIYSTELMAHSNQFEVPAQKLLLGSL